MLKNKLGKKHLETVVVALILGLFVISVASPASALVPQTGAGAVALGSWSDNGDNCNFGGSPDSCTPGTYCGGGVSETTATWAQVGTYTAGPGALTPPSVYVGGTQATLTSHGRYNFDIFGSFDPNGTSGTGNCLFGPPPFPVDPNSIPFPGPLPGVPGYAVPSTHVDVASTTPVVAGTSVSCSLDGNFRRVAVTVAIVDTTGSCRVDGSPQTAGAQMSNVTHTFTLNLLTGPDVDPGPPPTPGTCCLIVGGAYTET